ncbi:hypothetical protein SAMN05660772_01830 [Pasteurella testudinis DSM 23072]|uniref:Uncharacterized protein n=1 Tax=Pasteurella testudinis DSM 23072 TaxID=1122938 RepID=A0A1W1UK06_9PAST|nr:hypothetical protein [Pasteurella testudinis]SMB81379.1 hypothetical protein SAMN05660772_01830 [Pasteurella testudinis DSM 23072]SUB51387.1 Uncharacterised protein [Pasteurella testudinis]
MNTKDRLADTIFIDGDTAIVNGRHIRISGIDTPEVAHGDKGWSISGYLAQTVAENTPQAVNINNKHGGYGRKLGTLQSNDGALTSNEKLIRAGIAAPMQYAGSLLPDDVRRATITRDMNRWMGRDDEDSEVRDLHSVHKKLNLLNGDAREMFGFDPYVHTPKSTSAKNTFTKSLARGVDQLQGSLYSATAAAGNFIGSASLQQWGEEGATYNELEQKYNPTKVGTLDDIHSIGDVGTYIVERLGEQLPGLAVDIGAAIATGGTSAALGTGWKLGLRAGAGASAFTQNTGDAYETMQQAGVEDAGGAALLTGGAMAALDVAGLEFGVKNMLKPLGIGKEVSKEVVDNTLKAKALSVGRDLTSGLALGGIVEGSTETLQELVKEGGVIAAGGDTDRLAPLGDRLIESFAAGAVVGGAFGGGGRAVSHAGKGLYERKQKRDAERKEQETLMAEANQTHAPGDETVQVNVDGNVFKGKASNYNPNLNIEDEQGFSNVAPSPMAEPATHAVTAQQNAVKETHEPAPQAATEPVSKNVTQSENIAFDDSYPDVERPAPEPLNDSVAARSQTWSDGIRNAVVKGKERLAQEEAAFAKEQAQAARAESALFPEPQPKAPVAKGWNNRNGYNVRRLIEHALRGDKTMPKALYKPIQDVVLEALSESEAANARYLINNGRVEQVVDIIDRVADNDEVQRGILQVVDSHVLEKQRAFDTKDIESKSAVAERRAARLRGEKVDYNAKLTPQEEQTALEHARSYRDRIEKEYGRADEFYFSDDDIPEPRRSENRTGKTYGANLEATVDDVMVESRLKRDQHGSESAKTSAIRTLQRAVVAGFADITPLTADAGNARANTDRVLSELNRAIKRKDARTVADITERYTRRYVNAPLLASVATTDAKTLDEFAATYAGGKYSPRAIQDKLSDAYLIDNFKHEVRYDDARRLDSDKMSRVHEKLNTAVDQSVEGKNVRNEKLGKDFVPQHERVVATPEDIAADEQRFKDESLHLLWSRDVARDGEGFGSVDENDKQDLADGVNIQSEKVKTRTDGFDVNNVARLEAVLSAVEDVAAGKKTEGDKLKVYRTYEALLDVLPDDIKTLKNDTRTNMPEFEPMVHAIRDGLSNVIERNAQQQKQRTTTALTKQMRQAAIGGGIRKLSADALRTAQEGREAVLDGTSAKLIEIAQQYLTPSNDEIQAMANSFGVTPTQAREVLSAIDHAVYRNAKRHPVSKHAERGTLTKREHQIASDIREKISDEQLLDNLTRGSNMVQLVNIVTETPQVKVGIDGIKTAVAKLNEAPVADMLPEQVIELLNDTGLLSDASVSADIKLDNINRIVDRYGYVGNGTPVSQVAELNYIDGSTRKINLVKLLKQIVVDNEKVYQGSPTQLLVSSVSDMMSVLTQYDGGGTRKFADVSEAFSNLPDSKIIYRVADGYVTMGDYRAVQKQILESNNLWTDARKIERARDEAFNNLKELLDSADSILGNRKDAKNARDRIRRDRKIVAENERLQAEVAAASNTLYTAVNKVARENGLAEVDANTDRVKRELADAPVSGGVVQDRDALDTELAGLEQRRNEIAVKTYENAEIKRLHAELDEKRKALSDWQKQRKEMPRESDPVVKRDMGAIVREALKLKNLEKLVDGVDDVFATYAELAEVLLSSDFVHEGRTIDKDEIDIARTHMHDLSEALKVTAEYLSNVVLNSRKAKLGIRSELIDGRTAGILKKRLGDIQQQYYQARRQVREMANDYKRNEELSQIFGDKTTLRSERDLVNKQSGVDVYDDGVPETTDPINSSFPERIAEKANRSPLEALADAKLVHKQRRATINLNMNHVSGGRHIIYRTVFDPIETLYVTEIVDGKVVAEHVVENPIDNFEKVNALVAQYNGVLALHFADKGVFKLQTSVDVHQMAEQSDTDAKYSLDAVKAYEKMTGLKDVELTEAEIISQLAQEFVKDLPKDFGKRTARVEVDNTITRVTDPNKVKRTRLSTTIALLHESGSNPVRERFYESVAGLLNKLNLPATHNIDIVFDSGATLADSRVESTVDPVDGRIRFDIVMPRLKDDANNRELVNWALALGHELGHVVLDNYRAAFDAGAVEIDTTAKFEELYANALKGDKLDVETFADSYAQNMVENLFYEGGNIDSKIRKTTLAGAIYTKFKRIGTQIAEIINTVLADFAKLTGRQQKVNTVEQKTFLNQITEQRAKYDEHLRAVNERLLGTQLRPPVRKGKAILAHIRAAANVLRPTIARIESVSPAAAKLFMNPKTGYVNIKTDLDKMIVGAERRRIFGTDSKRQQARTMERGYNDLVNGKANTPNAKKILQYLQAIEDLIGRTLDPNKIGAYGYRPKKVIEAIYLRHFSE